MNMNALELKDTGLDNEDPAAQVGKALEELKAKLETKAANDNKLTERLDRLEAKMNRPGNVPANENEPKLETKAFNSFIRRGVERMDSLEAKALTVATDSAAGYLAPEQRSSRLFASSRPSASMRV